MATDSEWERIGEAAAAAGMEKSRYVIHRTLAPESLPPEVIRRAIRQNLVLAVVQERELRDAGMGGQVGRRMRRGRRVARARGGARAPHRPGGGEPVEGGLASGHGRR